MLEIDNRPRADFHVHLGDRTKEDFIEEALDNKVTVVAALDRGSEVKIDRLQALIDYGLSKGIRVIPGVESFTQAEIDGQRATFELIGLDFDLDHPDIYRILDPRAGIPPEHHYPKIDFQRSILEKMGFEVTPTDESAIIFGEIQSRQVAETAIRFCKIVLLNPNNQNLLNSDFWQDRIRKHLIERPEDEGRWDKALYWSIFAAGKDGYWPSPLNMQLIVKTIREANGVVVGAHPNFKIGDGIVNLDTVINYWFENKVDGLEGWDAGPLNKELALKSRARGGLVLGGSGRDIKYSNRIMGKGDINRQDMYISPKHLLDIKKYKLTHQAVLV